MQKYNILCCINDKPIFSYHPIENDALYEQIVINYVTSEKKEWITKETLFEHDFSFYYYEVQVDLALKVKSVKLPVEKFALKLLKYLFSENKI